MYLRKIATICVALLGATASFAQSATLTPAAATVSGGAVLTVTASAHYPGTPGAVGWSVTLPEGWTFVATSGSNPPQVGPSEGASGTLEWAYATVPADGAFFSFTVKAAGKPGSVRLPARVILRVDGKQQTVEVAPAAVLVTP